LRSSSYFSWLLRSSLYGGNLTPEHRTDLEKSGLTPVTIRQQLIRSVPPWMISKLLGFDLSGILSALLFPFPDPHGGFMNHVRMKIFPPLIDRKGHTIKYLQPKNSGVRLFFPLVTLDEALKGAAPLWLVEGEKKSLAVAQLGLAAVGFCGIQGWHLKGMDQLIEDFKYIQLKDRIIELLPDGDWRTNSAVKRGAEGFATALSAQGARPRLVILPEVIAA
jgi:hypothetical protein